MEESDALREYAISKVGGLERYFDGIISVEVTMDVEKERRIAQIFAHLINKKVVKASAESENMYTSIDQALEKTERQLKKYKDKVKDKGRGESIRKDLADEDSELGPAEKEDGREIVETDIYFKKPMPPDEAAMQLDSYSRDFLVFMNSDSDRVNIIYERDDGRYGLIDPQMQI